MEPLFKVNDLFPVYAAIQEDFAFDEIREDFAYILDAKGWKLFKRNGVSISLIAIDEVKGLPKFKEEIRLKSGKIPWELLKKVTAFFMAVYKKKKSEAVGYLYYHPTSHEWDFIPPTQTVAAASADYDKAPIKEGWLIAGTIHSHGSMSAFHSGTDHKDEEHFDGVHITIGKVDSVPEYAYSVMAQGARAKYDDPNDLVEGLDPSGDVPADWMEAVKLDEPKIIDDKKYGEAVEKLYTQYLEGKLTEKTYLKKLEAIENKIKDNDSKNDKPLIDASSGSYKPYKPPFNSGFISRYSRWGSD